MRRRIAVYIILAAAVLSGGCIRQPAAVLRGLLGLQVGNRFEYVGQGNEYAAYTAQVSHADGNLYQILEVSGGTILARVIELRPDGAYEILTAEEHYSGESLLKSPAIKERDRSNDTRILPWPLRDGVVWELPRGAEATVVTTRATHTVPVGSFKHVVHVRVVSPDTLDDDDPVTESFYAPGVGLLERRFTQGEFVVASRLNKRTGRHGR